MKKLLGLFFVSLSLSFLVGCGVMPGVHHKTFEVGNEIYVEALLTKKGTIVCPSRVSLVVFNRSTKSLEVSVDANPIVIVRPHGQKHIFVPESPFRNGQVIVSGVLFTGVGDGRVDYAHTEFPMPANGPVDGHMTAEENWVSGNYTIPYSPYGY